MHLNTSLPTKDDQLKNTSNQHQDEYPLIDATLHYTLLTISSAYIPFIIVSSSLVIAAVVLLKKLHTPHNIIILSISVGDILTASVLIPVHILRGIPVTREIIFSNEYLCHISNIFTDTFEVIELCSLTFLGFDTFIQITFPLSYRRHFSNKKTIACVITYYLVNISISATIFGLVSTDCRSPKNVYLSTLAGRLHYWYSLSSLVLLLSLCLIFGIYVRCKYSKSNMTPTERVTMWLLMAFIIFYIPTLLMLITYSNLDIASAELWRYVARLIRYLSPLTNGFFIYLTRPVYKFAFEYFLKTNPIHWNRIENQRKKKSFELKNLRKSLTLHLITKGNKNLKPNLSESGSDKKQQHKSKNSFREPPELAKQGPRSQFIEPFSSPETPGNSTSVSKTVSSSL